MEYLKTSPFQHLGSIELNRYRKLLNFKYTTILKYCSATYGIVKNLSVDPSFNNLKVVAGTKPWFFTIKAGYAIDKNFNMINIPFDLVDVVDVLTIMNGDPTGTPYLYIEYNKPDNVNNELGTVTLGANGTLTGVGTKFTECLRGEPFHAMKIQFTNSQNNFQEYEVDTVTSDTVASIKLAGGVTPEAGLTFKCIGTFAPGVPVPNESKSIFEHEEVNNFKIGIINPRDNFDKSQFERPDVQFVLAFVAMNFPNIHVAVDLRDSNLYTI